jgi:gas vesicle protein
MLAVAYFLLGFFVGAVAGAISCLLYIEMKTHDDSSTGGRWKP